MGTTRSRTEKATPIPASGPSLVQLEEPEFKPSRKIEQKELWHRNWTTRKLEGGDFVALLPLDIWNIIEGLLDAIPLAQLSACCRRLREIIPQTAVFKFSKRYAPNRP